MRDLIIMQDYIDGITLTEWMTTDSSKQIEAKIHVFKELGERVCCGYDLQMCERLKPSGENLCMQTRPGESCGSAYPSL